MPLRCGCELSASCSTHQTAVELQSAAGDVITRAFRDAGALARPEGVSPELGRALVNLRTIYERSHGRRTGSQD